MLLANFIEFRHGVEAAMAGDDGPDAEAAKNILAETFLLHRQWLLSHKKE